MKVYGSTRQLLADVERLLAQDFQGAPPVFRDFHHMAETFEPAAQHFAIPEIVGFPGFKSNEPLQLAAAGIPFKLYDPADYDIPGSFGDEVRRCG